MMCRKLQWGAVAAKTWLQWFDALKPRTKPSAVELNPGNHSPTPLSPQQRKHRNSISHPSQNKEKRASASSYRDQHGTSLLWDHILRISIPFPPRPRQPCPLFPTTSAKVARLFCTSFPHQNHLGAVHACHWDSRHPHDSITYCNVSHCSLEHFSPSSSMPRDSGKKKHTKTDKHSCAAVTTTPSSSATPPRSVSRSAASN